MMSIARFSQVVVWLLMTGALPLAAQMEESPIKIFGYFQNSFQVWGEEPYQSPSNSFNVQQLNVFLQKDLAKNWTAFVNFETVNSFSSNRRWGSFSLEEAWVRYGRRVQFNLKLGLLVPTFNAFNEIKNRTPLFPYVIRPLAYETSFAEFVDVEEYTPSRAYVQVNGYAPAGATKYEYAVYLGNSPNISSSQDALEGSRISGADTTTTFLVGGRLGVRHQELSAGVSGTYDRTNFILGAEEFVGVPPDYFREMPRFRVGADLTLHWRRFALVGEFVKVTYDDKTPLIDLNKKFFYGTLSYELSDRIVIYGSFWDNVEGFAQAFTEDFRNQHGLPAYLTGESNSRIPTAGGVYEVNDRIRIKLQLAHVNGTNSIDAVEYLDEAIASGFTPKYEFNHYSTAISVIF